MSDPYRSAEVRADSTPLRRSGRAILDHLLWAVCAGGLAWFCYRYVAESWVGAAASAVPALVALLSLYEALFGHGRTGNCPNCERRVELSSAGPGWLCTGCNTFLEAHGDRLRPTPLGFVADKPAFGVATHHKQVTFPDCCCVCLEPAAHRDTDLPVPYCGGHGKGMARGGQATDRALGPTLWFRSISYARRFASQNQLDFVGKNSRGDADYWVQHRGLAVGLTLLMAGAAAGVYYGLGYLESSGYEIVPTGLYGLVLWLFIKILGKKWLAVGLGSLAALFWFSFLGSFRRRV